MIFLFPYLFSIEFSCSGQESCDRMMHAAQIIKKIAQSNAGSKSDIHK
jgi:hypothetical protein